MSNVGGHTTAEALHLGQRISNDGTTVVVIDHKPLPLNMWQVTVAVIADSEFPDNSSNTVVLDLPGQHPIAGVHLDDNDEPARRKALHDAIEGIGKPMRRNIGTMDGEIVETSLHIWGVDIVKGSEVQAYGSRWDIVSVAHTGAQPVVYARQRGKQDISTLTPTAITAVYDKKAET